MYFTRSAIMVPNVSVVVVSILSCVMVTQCKAVDRSGDVQSSEAEIDAIKARHSAHDVGQSETSEISLDEGGGSIRLRSSGNEVNLQAQSSQGGQQVTHIKDTHLSPALFVAVVAGCSVAGLVGLIVAGVCWYRLSRNIKATSDVDYPAYGVTGPTKDKVGSPGDRKLAHSAQMYHYQHQKQQMIAMEKANVDPTKAGSEDDTDEENEEGDYTVFECPGLAPTGEMEVKNPLFSEETPITPSGGDGHGEHQK